MIRIRLSRTGKKNEPHFRIVVMEQRSKRNGKAIEYIGYHNPRKKQTTLDKERAKYWLSVGAQPTPTVHAILAANKLLEKLARPKREPLKSKKQKGQTEEVKKDEVKKEEVKPAIIKEETKVEKTEESKNVKAKKTEELKTEKKDEVKKEDSDKVKKSN